MGQEFGKGSAEQSQLGISRGYSQTLGVGVGLWSSEDSAGQEVHNGLLAWSAADAS